MRTYQLVLVLKSSLAESARKKFLDSVKAWLKGAKITKEEEWGEKVLAYTIKKEKSGFFYNFIFETKDELVNELEKRVTTSDNILRQLIIRQK